MDTNRQITNKFFRLYYEFCDKHILQKMLNNPNFGPPKDLEELINTWDDFGVPDALFGVVGCFICADDKVLAGKLKHPNI